MKFRHDLNSLRAVAVLAVLLFHFEVPPFSGGFAGVDVFFVISGYLMTAIIFRKFANNRFSFVDFYVARANRIIPALVTTCGLVALVSAPVVTPMEYKDIGNHIISSVGFFSNITYYFEIGYFNPSIQQKWLIHSWSLSVEWQFYVLYPIFIFILINAFGIKKSKYIILISTIICFILSYAITQVSPMAAYYLLPSRAWELLIGGLAFLFPWELSNKRKLVVFYTGWVLIGTSFIAVSHDTPWPGAMALMPTVGTFFIIQAHKQSALICRNTIMQKIGLWSYSIYLVHWPVWVWLNRMYDVQYYHQILGGALSILLGYLMWRVVEQINFKAAFSKENLTSMLSFLPIHMAVVSILFGGLVVTTQGLPARFSAISGYAKLESERLAAEQFYKANLIGNLFAEETSNDAPSVCSLDRLGEDLDLTLECLKLNLGKGGFLVVGDSHGRDFWFALKRAYPDLRFALLHQNSCVPSSSSKGNKCFPQMHDILEKISEESLAVTGLIISSLYGEFEDVHTLTADINSGFFAPHRIYLASANPRLENTISGLAIDRGEAKDIYDLSNTINDRSILVNKQLTKVTNAATFDKYEVFCAASSCKVADNLVPYFWDTGHLTEAGIDLVARHLAESDFLENAPQ